MIKARKRAFSASSKIGGRPDRYKFDGVPCSIVLWYILFSLDRSLLVGQLVQATFTYPLNSLSINIQVLSNPCPTPTCLIPERNDFYLFITCGFLALSLLSFSFFLHRCLLTGGGEIGATPQGLVRYAAKSPPAVFGSLCDRTRLTLVPQYSVRISTPKTNRL